jgi:hypothetical protein
VPYGHPALHIQIKYLHFFYKYVIIYEEAHESKCTGVYMYQVRQHLPHAPRRGLAQGNRRPRQVHNRTVHPLFKDEDALAIFRGMSFLQGRPLASPGQNESLVAAERKTRTSLKSVLGRIAQLPLGEELFLHSKFFGCRSTVMVFRVTGKPESPREKRLELLSFEGPPPPFAIGTSLKCRSIRVDASTDTLNPAERLMLSLLIGLMKK